MGKDVMDAPILSFFVTAGFFISLHMIFHIDQIETWTTSLLQESSSRGDRSLCLLKGYLFFSHLHADARMRTAVSQLGTSAEVVKRNMRLMSSCGSQEDMVPENKKSGPDIPYLSFTHCMKFGGSLPANTVFNSLFP